MLVGRGMHQCVRLCVFRFPSFERPALPNINCQIYAIQPMTQCACVYVFSLKIYFTGNCRLAGNRSSSTHLFIHVIQINVCGRTVIGSPFSHIVDCPFIGYHLNVAIRKCFTPRNFAQKNAHHIIIVIGAQKVDFMYILFRCSC